MATEEIPRSEWPAFFASFSRSHEGWLCTVAAPFYAPLAGISIEPGGEIAIRLDGHVTHVVPDPIRVFAESDAEGADLGLRIAAAARDLVTLRFRVAAVPETVDGLAR